jgi:hypothetical protein
VNSSDEFHVLFDSTLGDLFGFGAFGRFQG